MEVKLLNSVHDSKCFMFYSRIIFLYLGQLPTPIYNYSFMTILYLAENLTNDSIRSICGYNKGIYKLWEC